VEATHVPERLPKAESVARHLLHFRIDFESNFEKVTFGEAEYIVLWILANDCKELVWVSKGLKWVENGVMHLDLVYLEIYLVPDMLLSAYR